MVNLLFPALMVILEWIQYTFTPFGSWGAASLYTDGSYRFITIFIPFRDGRIELSYLLGKYGYLFFYS
jgi:hypothetical protein